jgi:hypothetical protein
MSNWHITTHPSYCHYIAHLISKALKPADKNGIIDTVGDIRLDLNEHGHIQSTTKFISVVDAQGKAYTIRIEENKNEHTV